MVHCWIAVRLGRLCRTVALRRPRACGGTAVGDTRGVEVSVGGVQRGLVKHNVPARVDRVAD